MYRKQKGMTMIGMALVLGLIVFFTLLGLKLIPPYLEDFKIQTALKTTAQQAQGGGMSQDDIVVALQKRLEIENMDTTIDLRKSLKIEARGKSKIVRIVYEVRIPMAYNITVLLDFNDSVEIKNVE